MHLVYYGYFLCKPKFCTRLGPIIETSKLRYNTQLTQGSEQSRALCTLKCLLISGATKYMQTDKHTVSSFGA